MRSAIYEGVVGHRRHSHDLTDHVANEFSQRLVLPLIYLDEVDEVMSLHPLWSAKRPNAAWMRRGDYLGDPDISLEVAARDEVEGALGRRPTGAIAMLGHLRTWGKISNPLCLFYCFDEETGGLEAIVAHVTNTPWGERHSYVMDGRSSCARLPKVMHVSPLLGMDHDYHFDWSEPGATLNFGIEVRHGESLPGFVLQIGEQGVAAGIAEVEGDPVDAGPQVVPFGPGLHLDVGKARAAQ